MPFKMRKLFYYPRLDPGYRDVIQCKIRDNLSTTLLSVIRFESFYLSVPLTRHVPKPYPDLQTPYDIHFE